MSRALNIQFFLFLGGLFLAPFTFAGTNTVPGVTDIHATLHSIGIEWKISGDDNHNAICTVQYRISGSNQWKTGLPLYRVDFNQSNTLAGSLFFLEPATQYEVTLNLQDPDGGNTQKIISVNTRSIPQQPENGRIFHVAPGNGGGSGLQNDPFLGLDSAQNMARPGDTFILHGGFYPGRFEFDVSGNPFKYIVWQGAENEEAIIDGVRINASHLWFENLTIRAPESDANQNGILTYNAPEDVVITQNIFEQCHNCIYLNHGGENWTITDNHITGNTDPDSDSFSGEGIELNHSSGHVVAYNTITHVADGISYPHRNCDIYGNDIFNVSDDGIEPDYAYANIRIWGNRITDAHHNGISMQPMNGAPWYIIRNQVAAPTENALKFRTQVDRLLIAHNTFIGWSGVQSSGSNFLINVQSNNNLWISMNDRYVWENGLTNGGGPANWRTNLDYDGFDWGNYPYAFKWGDRYTDLSTFSAATGLETHAIRIRREDCFAQLDIPEAPPAAIPLQYITLKNDCNAVDAGIILPGINDHFLGNGPDLGAFELGADLPHYGIRKKIQIPEPALTPEQIWMITRKKYE